MKMNEVLLSYREGDILMIMVVPNRRKLNVSALIAVAVFAVALLSIFGAPVHRSGKKPCARGEIDIEGIRIFRWAILGYITLYVLLAITAFLT